MTIINWFTYSSAFVATEEVGVTVHKNNNKIGRERKQAPKPEPEKAIKENAKQKRSFELY